MSTDEKIEKLISDYGDAILRMCFLYLRDYQLAEDATQETFIKAMKSFERFEYRSSEKTWLTRIAINCCKNIMRTHWFKIMKNNIESHSKEMGDDIFDNLVESDSISGAIMKLDLSDRKIIILYYYQELSIKDIAMIMNISENTANQRLYRARKKLKQFLVEDGDYYVYQGQD